MTVINDAETLWRQTAESLSEQVSTAVWMSVFTDVRGLYLDENCLTISVPNPIVRDRIDQRFRELILDTLRDVVDRDLGLEIRLDLTHDAPIITFEEPSLPEPTTPHAGHAGSGNGSAGPSSIRTVEATSGDRALNINPRYTFESFVTGPSNRFAHAAALSVAERPARSYNPLFVYGAAGLGKTHLLHAIAHYVHENYPASRVRYISTETLLNEFIDAIRNNAQSDFKRRYRETDVLLVDDVQFMEGKEQLQEEFFHTFNTLHQADRQIVLSSDRPPDAVATLEDRLRSRFKMGLVTDIQPPDLETRLAILRTKAAQTNVGIPGAVLEFIVTHVTNNIRELEGALNRVSAYANLTQSEPSVEVAKQVLGDIIVDHEPRRITPELIMATTARFYGFEISDLEAKDRRRPLVLARQVCMYLFRYLTDLSYPDIGRRFGGRDHTTVMYGYEKIKTQMTTEQQIYDDVTSLIQQIKTER